MKWIFINKCLIRYLNKRKNGSLILSYDLFCEKPRESIRDIELFLRIKIPKDYVSKIRNMNYHNIGGNRLANKENRKNIKEIKKDEKWKEQQGRFTQFISSIITYFPNKRWVYNEN